MPRMTSAEYALYQMKERPNQAPSHIVASDDKEQELHEQIISWCNRQDPQVPYGHGRMDKRTGRTPGEPDFYLLLHGGKLMMVECKTGSNTLSDDQRRFMDKAYLCGHLVHVVTSYQQFIELVKPL